VKIRSKELGIGTISLVLCLVGLLFSFSFNNFSIGDYIINGIGLKSWSNGNSGLHYTIYYSLIFFISSFFIGLKYKKHFGSKLGRNTSAVIIITFFIMSLFVVQ